MSSLQFKTLLTAPHTRGATEMKGSNPSRFQLCFRSLFHSGRGFAFPCDSKGQVPLDSLSERARNNYFYARAMVGRELSTPAVEAHMQ